MRCPHSALVRVSLDHESTRELIKAQYHVLFVAMRHSRLYCRAGMCVFHRPGDYAEVLWVLIRCHYDQQSAVQQRLLEDIATGKDVIVGRSGFTALVHELNRKSQY